MKSQTITFVILLLVSGLLLIEFYNRSKSPKKTANNEDELEVVETANNDSSQTSQTSVVDSIAALYSPFAFKEKQLKFPRVKAAYKEQYDSLLAKYKQTKIDPKKMRLYLRAFKKEQLVEVWAKNDSSKQYTLLTTYDFCANSGTLGPKRKEGDLQIPEGFYRINAFNPQSKFHLSLGVNYPNRSDKILGDTTDLGSDIFIHGGCATVGCIPITNPKIEELYMIIVDARAADQKRVPITIFPAKLSEENFESLKAEYAEQHPEWIDLWASLKDAYLFFQECKQLPTITFLPDGKHKCNTACN